MRKIFGVFSALILILIIYSVMQIGKAFTSKIPEVNSENIITKEESLDNNNLTEESEIEETKKDVSQTEKTKENELSTSSNNNKKSESKSSTASTKTEQNTTKKENKSNTSTSMYDSITGGKKEYATSDECFTKGSYIQERELNDVLDYNEQHLDNQKKSDIQYFRCYPVIDDNGEGWFLQLYCYSGECNSKYKTMYK